MNMTERLATVEIGRTTDAYTSIKRASGDKSHMDPFALATELSVAMLGRATMFSILREFSVTTGGFVQLSREYDFLPALIGNDNQPVFLYQLIEAIDEFIDYDSLQKEYPTLTYSQIAGAVSFLRKVAQINSQNIDIDELEDEILAEDPMFLDELRKAFENRGNIANVLSEPD